MIMPPSRDDETNRGPESEVASTPVPHPSATSTSALGDDSLAGGTDTTPQQPSGRPETGAVASHGRSARKEERSTDGARADRPAGAQGAESEPGGGGKRAFRRRPSRDDASTLASTEGIDAPRPSTGNDRTSQRLPRRTARATDDPKGAGRSLGGTRVVAGPDPMEATSPRSRAARARGREVRRDVSKASERSSCVSRVAASNPTESPSESRPIRSRPKLTARSRVRREVIADEETRLAKEMAADDANARGGLTDASLVPRSKERSPDEGIYGEGFQGEFWDSNIFSESQNFLEATGKLDATAARKGARMSSRSTSTTDQPGAYQVDELAPQLSVRRFGDSARRNMAIVETETHGEATEDRSTEGGSQPRRPSWFGWSRRHSSQRNPSSASGRRMGPRDWTHDGAFDVYRKEKCCGSKVEKRALSICVFLLAFALAAGITVAVALSSRREGSDNGAGAVTDDGSQNEAPPTSSGAAGSETFLNPCAGVGLPSSPNATLTDTVRYDALRQLLLHAGIPNGHFFDELCSPQDLALTFLAEVDPLRISINPRLSSDYSIDAILERYVLSLLHYSTQGSRGWKTGYHVNWMTGATVCDWEGIRCADACVARGSYSSILCKGTQLRVKEIDLTGMDLDGTLPGDLGMLTHLVILILENNEMHGSIPTGLGNLKNLEVLSLARNSFVGAIPVDIGRLSNLEIIRLERNALSGSLPTTISGMSNLVEMKIGHNSMTGPLPKEVGDIKTLKKISLEKNKLTDSIPTTLWSLDLVQLDLSQNQIGGNLSEGIGNLTNLVGLKAGECKIEGVIPASLGRASNLVEIDLRMNRLTGRIPDEFANLTHLRMLDLEDNRLTGKIFNGIGNLDNLVLLWLGANQLSDTLPSAIGDMSSLEDLDLKQNELSGTIPASFAKLQNIKRLTLIGNQIVGPVPEALCALFNDDGKKLYINSKLTSYDSYKNGFIECSCCSAYVYNR